MVQAAQRALAGGDAGRVGLERHPSVTVHVAIQLAAVAQQARVETFRSSVTLPTASLPLICTEPSFTPVMVMVTVAGAIHVLHGEGPTFGLVLAQVLHQAVVNVVGPGAVSP